MFLKERKHTNKTHTAVKCCRENFEDENPKFIFIQPFYPKVTREALEIHFELEQSNWEGLSELSTQYL